MNRIEIIHYQAMGYLSKEDPDLTAEYAMGFPNAPKVVQDRPDIRDVKIARASSDGDVSTKTLRK